nr:MAG TPA: hypothetical protein [Caudoviricetes sp.]
MPISCSIYSTQASINGGLVAHSVLFARKIDFSRLTVHYLSAKFE